MRLCVLSALFFTCLGAFALRGQAQDLQNAEGARAFRAEQRNWEAARFVSAQALRRRLDAICSFGSRLAGSEGERRTLAYAEAEFRRLGLVNIRREPFKVTVPDPGARGTLAASDGSWSVIVYPLWPNLVRTSTCDVEGRLVYGGRGSLEELSGRSLAGAIVLLEFDSGANWKNAIKLGASAVVFIEPAEARRYEAEAKFSAVPLDAPRFWLPVRFAGPVVNAAARGQAATLRCKQGWIVRETYNLLADLPGTDPSLRRERILLSAHADAMSVAPGFAPGAQEATGIAALLELAAVSARSPGKRPLTFALFAAHGLGLQGAREFVDRRLEGVKEHLLLAVSLDLSSGSPSLGTFAQGWFYEYRPEAWDVVRSLSRVLRSQAERIAPLVQAPEPGMALADAVNDGDGRPWKNFIPGKFALACEPFLQARYNALTFATIDDARPHVDTPSNTPNRVNLAHTLGQTRTLAYLLGHLRNDSSGKGAPPPDQIPLDVSAPRRMSLVGGFATLTGRVVEFDPLKSFLPDVAVADALVASLHERKTMMGVRGTIVQAVSGADATYRIAGAVPVSSWIRANARPVVLAAFRLDQATGEITYAPSQGMLGDWLFRPYFPLTTAEKSTPLVVFPCVATDLYDLTDPQDLKVLSDYRVLDAATEAAPTYFGFFLSGQAARSSSEAEDVAVLFTPPALRWKLLMGSGLGEVRLALTNAREGAPNGQGYVADGGQRPGEGFELLPLLAARDMIALNQSRLEQFEKYGIIAPSIRKLHAEAKRLLDAAQASVSERDWATADRDARSAWGYALRAHPVIQGTANDAVAGVVLYLLLIIPFAYFFERLVFAGRSLVRQLTVTLGLFFGAFALLRAVHPAFEIVANPTMVFVAFVMGTLSLLVIGFIVGKFETSLKTIQAAERGVHEVDVRRISVAMAAFNLGIGNMRRRKARTALTTLTLVVMTFIVLSFSSVVPDVKLLETPSDSPATYPGLLVRTPGLDPLQPAAFHILENLFRAGQKSSVSGPAGPNALSQAPDFEGPPAQTAVHRSSTRGPFPAVVRRVWFYGGEISESSALAIRRAESRVGIRAVLGLDPGEARVTKLQRAILPGGRWFDEGDERAMILPRSLAEQLRVDAEDVGRGEVEFQGERYVVIAIIEDALLKAITDLDGDGILPADFALSRRFQAETQSVADEFRRFLRLDPSVCAILPAQTALELGAEVRSVAVSFASPDESRAALDALMPRMRVNLYASVPATGAGSPMQVSMFSVRQGAKSTGLGFVLVQTLIASVFVLNTMVASVYERRREIGIFSAVGLAPNHIALLFFAESLVYGVLGAVCGYFLAQGAARIVLATDALPGLNLNFSATSAALSACLVMAVVLLSTIYPARIAAKIAAPALDEGLTQTEPEGDLWTITLPFSLGREEALGLMRFLAEWFRAYEEYTIGEFVASGTSLTAEGREAGSGAPSATTTVWPAPYDLGVAQRVELRALPTEIEGVFRVELRIERLGGDPSNWLLVNRRFLGHLRRQFLTWRTLDAEKRAAYQAQTPARAEAS